MKKININKRRKLCMKKNVLTKGILILLAIALLTIGFSGCSIIMPPPCATGTVNINIDDNYEYEIWIDGVYWDTTNGYGDITLYGIPTGYHHFYVISTDWECDGDAYPTIICGANDVSIAVDCGY
jgi:hypothetical protein